MDRVCEEVSSSSVSARSMFSETTAVSAISLSGTTSASRPSARTAAPSLPELVEIEITPVVFSALMNWSGAGVDHIRLRRDHCVERLRCGEVSLHPNTTAPRWWSGSQTSASRESDPLFAYQKIDSQNRPPLSAHSDCN